LKKVTTPVEEDGLTVAVSVTGEPNTEGFGWAISTVEEAKEITIELLVADVRPVDDAVSLKDPAVVNMRLLKVARPFTALTEVVPPTPVGEEVMFTVAVEPLTGLPFESSTVTTTLPMGLPVTPVVGCDVIASFEAVPPIRMLLLMALDNPVDAAVRVYRLPAVKIRWQSRRTQPLMLCRRRLWDST
jgi:hypothetical protein